MIWKTRVGRRHTVEIVGVSFTSRSEINEQFVTILDIEIKGIALRVLCAI